MANSGLRTAVSKQDDMYVNQQNAFSAWENKCFCLKKETKQQQKKPTKTPKLQGFILKNKQTDFKKLKLKAKVEIMTFFFFFFLRKKIFSVKFLLCRIPV